MYALRAALHAEPVGWVEVVVFTYWTALLDSRRARGHDSAHVAKYCPTRSSLTVTQVPQCLTKKGSILPGSGGTKGGSGGAFRCKEMCTI